MIILAKTQNSCSAETVQKIHRQVPYDQGFRFFLPDGHYSGESGPFPFARS
jgi:hypothetical protein